MAPKSLFVVLVIWITMAQATINTRAKRDIKSTVEARIQALTYVAQSASDAADNFKRTIQSQQDMALQQFEREMNDIQADISAAVANATALIQDAANDVQQILRECLQSAQQEGLSLLASSSENILECFTERIDSIMKQIGYFSNTLSLKYNSFQ